MNYIDILESKFPEIMKKIAQAVSEKDFSGWDSLIINKRKPHTYRAFFFTEEGYRICLHRFDECGPDECFKHPHPWPAAFLVLHGSYKQWVGLSPDIISDPEDVMNMVVTKGCMYEIAEKNVWHSVQPLSTTYTIMLNDKPWDLQHQSTRTTKGKDLEKMSDEMLERHLDLCGFYLHDHMALNGYREDEK